MNKSYSDDKSSPFGASKKTRAAFEQAFRLYSQDFDFDDLGKIKIGRLSLLQAAITAFLALSVGFIAIFLLLRTRQPELELINAK